MRSSPFHNKLVTAVSGLYMHTSSPFGTVVAEGLRMIGVPIADPEPAESIRGHVADAVGLYCEAVEQSDPFADVLGPVFEEVGSKGGKAMAGQFFTPSSVCLMMAEMQLADWRPEPKPNGEPWSICEPACGSGAMLLACLRFLAKTHGPGVLRMWELHAVDLSLTLARTCALQILVNLAALPAQIGRLEVWHGNTLSMDMKACVVRAQANPAIQVLADAYALANAIAGGPVDDDPEPAMEGSQYTFLEESAA